MTPGLASRLCLRCLLPMLLAFDAAAVETGTALVKAPPFELPDLERNEHRLSDYADKVLVVNFWASWCVPCREELPSMNRAARKLIEQPVAWIAINVGEDPQAVEAFLADYSIDFTVLLDPSGRVSQSWQVVGMPTTLVINREGYVAHRIVGKREWDDEVHLQMLIEVIDN
jgi:thiol-disulfide isomerase/thioredoxin